MKGPSQSRSVVHFGVFHVDLRAGELSKNGVKVRLQEQPFQILALLLEHAGKVVSREELRQRLWPADTFVDFDHSLGTAINKIREALGDSADNPRFVETLARRGYRFIAPVSLEPEAAPAATTHAPLLRTRWLVLALAVVLSGTIYFAWHGFRQRLNRPTGKVMLAVLPFDNLSGDPEQEYFSDGMTEEIISQLGRLHPQELAVIARTSSMVYKNGKKSLAQIGKELDAQYVIEGAVRRAGNRVRIVARLIRTSDQTTLLDQGYDGELRDVLVLQSDVARAVAREVEIKLTPRQQAQLGSRPVNPEAYEAYLKGHYFLSKFTGDAEQKALEYFQQAIEKDPGYARAYAGMSAAYALLTNFGVLTPKDGIPKAKSAAAKAIEMDSAQDDAYCQLGWIKMLYDWDFPEAEKEFQHAIELNPNFASAHEGYSMLLAALGRFDESLAEMKRARDLDPLSLIINTDFCAALYYARRYDLAIAQCHIAIEIDPNFPMAHLHLGKIYQAKGMYEEAQTALLKEWSLDHDPDNLRAIRKAYATSGWTGFWQKTLDLQLQQRTPWSYGRAVAYANLGKKEQALHWLEKTYEDRLMLVIFINVDPWFDALHPDPRFQELLRRIGLPEANKQN